VKFETTPAFDSDYRRLKPEHRTAFRLAVKEKESMRGTGLGKEIMSATLDVAWGVGCYKAMFMASSTKPPTHAFYKARGLSADVRTAYVARPS
jgi:GNAT superfamily N-acetyltransferase